MCWKIFDIYIHMQLDARGVSIALLILHLGPGPGVLPTRITTGLSTIVIRSPGEKSKGQTVWNHIPTKHAPLPRQGFPSSKS